MCQLRHACWLFRFGFSILKPPKKGGTFINVVHIVFVNQPSLLGGIMGSWVILMHTYIKSVNQANQGIWIILLILTPEAYIFVYAWEVTCEPI